MEGNKKLYNNMSTMKYNPEKHHRKSIRLKDYDYLKNGYYFITICSKNRECIFGNLNRGAVYPCLVRDLPVPKTCLNY